MKLSTSRSSLLIYAFAIVVYLIGTVLFARRFSEKSHLEIGRPGKPEVSESYSCRRFVCGWPQPYFAMVDEEFDAKNEKPRRVVVRRFSVISLAVNLLAVCSLVCLFRLVTSAISLRQFTLRQVFVCVLCVCILLATFVLTRYQLLAPIPARLNM